MPLFQPSNEGLSRQSAHIILFRVESQLNVLTHISGSTFMMYLGRGRPLFVASYLD